MPVLGPAVGISRSRPADDARRGDRVAVDPARDHDALRSPPNEHSESRKVASHGGAMAAHADVG